MKEFIEKLFVALEEQAESVTNDFAEEMYKYIKIEDVKNIVNQLAEEYSKDQNWQTTRNYLDEKYFSKIRELSANYNHPCEDIPINFDWVFGLIEKMEMQLAEEHKDKEVLSMAEITANHSKAVLEELKRIRDGGWIPCSERLPELETDVFIYTKQNGIAIASLSKPDIFWTDEEGFHILDVIAWQPLPAPYQPKGE